MICITITDETEKAMYEHYKASLEVKHSPPFYAEFAKAYIKSYEFKHGNGLPEIKHFTDEVSGD